MVDVRTLELVTVPLYAVVVVITAFRLILRARAKSWWWDDTCSLLATVCMSMIVAGSVILGTRGMRPPELPLSIPDEADIWILRAHYPVLLGYYIPVWAARLSILFTIMRFASEGRQRRILGYIAYSFLLQWAILIAQGLWILELNTTWNYVPGTQPSVMSLTQLVTTIISDTALVIAPIWIVRGVSDRALRFRLILVFSTSVATTAAALVHAVASLLRTGALALIGAVVEESVAILVCNAFVIFLIVTVSKSRQNTEAFTLTTVVHLDATVLQDCAWDNDVEGHYTLKD